MAVWLNHPRCWGTCVLTARPVGPQPQPGLPSSHRASRRHRLSQSAHARHMSVQIRGGDAPLRRRLASLALLVDRSSHRGEQREWRSTQLLWRGPHFVTPIKKSFFSTGFWEASRSTLRGHPSHDSRLWRWLWDSGSWESVGRATTLHTWLRSGSGAVWVGWGVGM